ncbi:MULTISPECIES: glycosyltransferase family 25 protein [unclassified Mesorhizobium]|uniref:glycosyltransferase family 25 protein n=1 Tax=unclassified Mesorhizobium TaxID=325217 RepID=UPI000FCCC4BB|nr:MULTISPECIES: glycosyltransferase family 25 protein [unclassified Mesorhizobium]RUW72481.1 hypothetical protein EOA31_15340 [Mesorhizobium sp. M4B.F.Ca.ET.049.02.1.2]RVD30660.1 hypothetical protein EN738_05285 [Mesorhizobium sp. M4B.F.Ca.ET.017.02.2.1]TGV25620.1 hypothetical protein EN786_14660 [Mesorhizobium sp. M4B.F.Ca.ET.143.01.1.1]
MFPNQVFCRICHVKIGYEERELHIRSEFAHRGVPVHWYLDHDVADLSAEDRQAALKPAQVSLARKHIGIWREFLNTDLPYCLVFEDDVFLARNFVARLEDALQELAAGRQAVVYLGNGGNYYTPRSKLTKGRSLYPANHSRCTDSYILTRSAAQARCNWFDRNELNLPIDIAVNDCDKATGTDILWFERPIVEQGTHNGRFTTSIEGGKQRPLWWKRIEWRWKKYRRQFFGHTAN